MNRDVNELLRLREYYKMTEEEFIELIQCTGVVNFSKEVRIAGEIAEYQKIGASLLEQMRPYWIMYELCITRIEQLLAREIGRIHGN